jgi:hypothetical protein
LVHLSHRTLFAAAALAGLGVAIPATAQTPAGMLECNVSPPASDVVVTTKALSCVFHPTSGPIEFYQGTLNTVGLDIGFTGAGKLSWGVAVAGPYPGRYPLAGTFSGASGGLTIGAGAEANTLVGGNGNSINLQPLSVSEQTGLDINAGVSSLTLVPSGPDVIPPPPLPPGPPPHR